MTKISDTGPKGPQHSTAATGDKAATDFAQTLKTTQTRRIAGEPGKSAAPTRLTVAEPERFERPAAKAPTYETVELVGLRDILQNLKRRRTAAEGVDPDRRVALIERLGALVGRKAGLPEIAVVNMSHGAEAGVSFNFVAAGETVFVSERLYSAWQKNRDGGVFERALGELITARFGAADGNGNGGFRTVKMSDRLS